MGYTWQKLLSKGYLIPKSVKDSLVLNDVSGGGMNNGVLRKVVLTSLNDDYISHSLLLSIKCLYFCQ